MINDVKYPCKTGGKKPSLHCNIPPLALAQLPSRLTMATVTMETDEDDTRRIDEEDLLGKKRAYVEG